MDRYCTLVKRTTHHIKYSGDVVKCKRRTRSCADFNVDVDVGDVDADADDVGG